MGSTIQGEPTDAVMQVALYNKLDAYWLDRRNQAFGDVEDKTVKGLIAKISEIL